MWNKWSRKKRRLERRAKKLEKKMGNAKKILPWIGAGFFALFALVFWPSFASVLFVLIAALFAPISKWQEFIKRYLPQKWIKPVLLAVLIVIAFIATPSSTEAEAPVNTEATVATSSPVPTTLPTEAPTAEPTEEPTPEPTEVPATPEPTDGVDDTQISATIRQNSDGTLQVPCASYECEGWHYKDAVKLYEDAGFTNIQAIPYEIEIDPELTFDGCVVIVSIGEDAVFFEDASYNPDTQVTIGYVTAKANGETVIPEDSSFEVHFIDVGQADAALVLCDGEAMLIDGGNREDSSLIYSYLKTNGIEHLDYIVATHAHEDHVGGLSGALNYATVDTAYCSVAEYDSEVFSDFVKYLGKQNVSITVPADGESFKLGSATVDIIGPTTKSDDPNNMSLVLRIVYGETSFLFTGDAEREEEQDILNAGYTLDSTVLKVGHHGSENSTTYPFLNEIMPEYAVISVGEDNTYGHPTEAALSRLRDADVKVYRTDLQGTIICVSDGKKVSFTVSRNEDADTLVPFVPVATPAPTAAPEAEDADTEPDYVINKNTGKFHHPYCSSVDDMKASNRKDFFGTRDELIAMGYSPCGRCHP